MMALDGGIRALVDFQVTPPFGSNISVAAAGGKPLAMSHVNLGFSAGEGFHPDSKPWYNNFDTTALPSRVDVGSTAVGLDWEGVER